MFERFHHSFQDSCLSMQVSYLAGQPMFAPIRIDLSAAVCRQEIHPYKLSMGACV